MKSATSEYKISHNQKQYLTMSSKFTARNYTPFMQKHPMNPQKLETDSISLDNDRNRPVMLLPVFGCMFKALPKSWLHTTTH